MLWVVNLRDQRQMVRFLDRFERGPEHIGFPVPGNISFCRWNVHNRGPRKDDLPGALLRQQGGKPAAPAMDMYPPDAIDFLSGRVTVNHRTSRNFGPCFLLFCLRYFRHTYHRQYEK